MGQANEWDVDDDDHQEKERNAVENRRDAMGCDAWMNEWMDALMGGRMGGADPGRLVG